MVTRRRRVSGRCSTPGRRTYVAVVLAIRSGGSSRSARSRTLSRRERLMGVDCRPRCVVGCFFGSFFLRVGVPLPTHLSSLECNALVAHKVWSSSAKCESASRHSTRGAGRSSGGWLASGHATCSTRVSAGCHWPRSVSGDFLWISGYGRFCSRRCIFI